MPVRIYDIAKKLGIESKEVLAKAKALGITAAKVPSSSLDKITAEYLENELGGVPAAAAPAPPVAPAPNRSVIIVLALPPPVEPAPRRCVACATRPSSSTPVEPSSDGPHRSPSGASAAAADRRTCPAEPAPAVEAV